MNRTHPPRNVHFHLTISEADAELLDKLRRRMGVDGVPLPHNAVISRALHLLEAVQERGRRK